MGRTGAPENREDQDRIRLLKARAANRTGARLIARQAHAHLRHGGPFEACRRCNGFTWSPSEFGILIHTATGKRVEVSEAARRLLVP